MKTALKTFSVTIFGLLLCCLTGHNHFLAAEETIAVACPNSNVALAKPPVGAVVIRVENGVFSSTSRFFPLGKKRSRRALRCALGDVDGDTFQDIITVPGPGTAPTVRIFDGETRAPIGGDLIPFNAFDDDFRSGVFVAAGDVNNDGRDDIITAAGGVNSEIRVFNGDGGAQLVSFDAFDEGFTGGVRVAAGDINGDGFAEIVAAPGPGAQPEVKVFNGQTGELFTSFLAFDASFDSGVFVALGDINGDDRFDIITAPGPGSDLGPLVRVFNESDGELITSFFAYGEGFSGGVTVAAGDINGDGVADIITGPARSLKPDVRVFDGSSLTQLDNFFAYPRSFRGGVFVGQ